MSRLSRFLKIAALLYDNNNEKELSLLCAQFNAFIKKHGHYMPMQGPGDYDFAKETGKLPWSGSITEFLKNFPGGIPEWKAAREKLKSETFEFKNEVMINPNRGIGEPTTKKAHFVPDNTSGTPNPWKRNMDYAEYENSPYFGSISEFMEKFPGGIREWVEWRAKTKEKRNSMYDLQNKKTKKAAIDVEDLTKPEEEYEPTAEEKEEAEKVPTAEETILANKMIGKILDELLEDGLVSDEDVEEWQKNQPLKIEQRKADDKDGFREELAELEHDQWIEWAKSILKSEDISKERKERWEEECFKPYNKLTEEMKGFDREWADKVIKIVKKHTDMDKKAHYVPVGGDDVGKFEKESPLYSGEGLEKFKSIKEFLKQYRHSGQSADDAALKAVKDMVDYWKLLLKGKNRRKQKGKK